jgi:hypothetical protein
MPQSNQGVQGVLGRISNKISTAVNPQALLAGLAGAADALAAQAIPVLRGLGSRAIGALTGVAGVGPASILLSALLPKRTANDALFLQNTVPVAEAERVTPVPRQTASPAASVISPSSLAALSLTPSVERTNNAFVPQPPPVQPSQGASQALSQTPGFSGFLGSSVTPAATPPTTSPSTVSPPSVPPSVQRARAVPLMSPLVSQRALLETLATRPEGGLPAGFVTTPESLPFSAQPRKKLRQEQESTPNLLSGRLQ